MKRRDYLSFLIMASFLLSLFPFLFAKEKKDHVRYEIWVELDHQKRMLYGKEVITWFNYTNDELKDFWFHLYWNAFKNEKSAVAEEAIEEGLFRRIKEGEWGWIDVKSIRLPDGTDLKKTMQFMVVDEPLRRDDQTVMRVLLPKPLKPGEERTFLINFESKIPRTIMRSGYYHNGYFIAQWFPKPGVYEQGKGWNCHQYHLNSEFFADFAEFKVHITVPKEFVVGASGKQISSEVNERKGTITYTFWQDRIHDFAWTADPDYIKIERDFIPEKEVDPQEYQELSKILKIPVDEIKLRKVRMILLINPEHKGQIERHFKALRMALKFYGLWYGPYPYETITLVDPPFRSGAGGMEYPTLFTAGTIIFTNRKVLIPEGVIVHEFGHQYWYGMCANNEFEEAWLDEGINTYSTGKVLARAYGPNVIPLIIGRIPFTRYTENLKYYDYQMDRAGSINIVKFDPILKNSWQFYSRISYSLNVYSRASACLYTLENILGEDVMLRVLRTFQMRFRFRHPKTEDFIDVVNEVSGRDMSWFFEEFFFGTKEFDYGVTSVTCEKVKSPKGIFEKDGKKVEITGKEKIGKEEKEDRYFSLIKVRRFGEAKLGGDVKLKIKVVFEDGKEEIRYWDGQSRWTEFRFITKSKLKYAQVDPDNLFLIDANITNNSLKLKADRTGAIDLANTILFWIQNLLLFVSSLS